ncbi:MAG: S41 family peptidase [Paludibacteraceae bacterium]|nr:S41 family peptidase [Paludibacteraceae bacterium]
MRRFCYILLPLLLLVGCDKQDVMEPNYNAQDNLEALWKIMDERYCFFEEKNLNWDSIYYEYKRRLKGVRTVFGLFDLMDRMLGELEDGHVNLYTPFAVSSCSSWYDDYPKDFSFDLIKEHYLHRNYRTINGLYYDTIDDVGYMYVSSFSVGIASATMQYVDYFFRNSKGVIIDVRNNGGGELTASESLAACMFKEKRHVGYIRHKTGKGHNDFSEPKRIFIDPAVRLIDWSDRRVVVLTNRRTYSSANDFVNIISYADNVTVIGGKTGGGGGMPLSRDLPIGWMVRFSAVPSFNADMESIDGGIDPDEFVHINEEDYAAGVDPILEKALRIIRNIE